MRQITITIQSNPKAQKRHRDARINGITRRYDPSSTTKKAILFQAKRFAPREPLTGALRVDCSFYFERPKSHYRTGKYSHILKESAPIMHTIKPDRDNLDKIVLDALKGVFWIDDCQICLGEIRKFYSVNPRTVLKIKPIYDMDLGKRLQMEDVIEDLEAIKLEAFDLVKVDDFDFIYIEQVIDAESITNQLSAYLQDFFTKEELKVPSQEISDIQHVINVLGIPNAWLFDTEEEAIEYLNDLIYHLYRSIGTLPPVNDPNQLELYSQD